MFSAVCCRGLFVDVSVPMKTPSIIIVIHMNDEASETEYKVGEVIILNEIKLNELHYIIYHFP